MSGWLAALSTLIGVIIGALLRPMLDNYFELRKKTLHIDLSAGGSESVLPDKAMKIVWGSRTFSRLVRTPFTIENRSGWTMRDFELRIDLLDQADLPDGEALLFEVVIRGQPSASFDNVTNAKGMRPVNVYKFDYAEPKSRIHGFSVANCDGVLKFTSPDLEIAVDRTSRTELEAARARFLAVFALILAVVTLLVWPELPSEMLRRWNQWGQ